MKIYSELKRKVVADAVRQHPETPSRQLARVIYATHSMLWPNEEAARNSIRSARGANGDRLRKECKIHGSTPAPVSFPESKAKDWTDYQLTNGKWLVLSDVHIPFHHKQNAMSAVKAGKDMGANGVLLNGDICDFYSISRFDKDPTKSKMVDEIKATRQFLRWIRQEFPRSPIVYKLGNHDERMDKWVFGKSVELIGLPHVRLPHLLAGAWPADEDSETEPETQIEGITFVADQRKIKAGKHLNILHGHEYGKSGIAPAVNPARGAFTRLLDCALVAHSHRTSQHNETTANGRLVACFSQGCLCEMTPEYARINKWDAGASFVTLNGDDFNVELIRLLNGKRL